MTQTNIVIVHEGTQPYLRTAVETANRHGNTVTVLGFGGRCPQRDAFEAKYRPMANYPRTFDLQCFGRYFLLQQFMADQNLPSAFHMDSDVLMFDDMRAFEREHLLPRGIAAGIHMPQNQAGLRLSYGGHTSYWTRGALESFCQYLIDVYDDMPAAAQEKWDWHRKTDAPGGVCDMTMLYLWSQTRNDLGNFAAPLGGAVFDYNINSAENTGPEDYRTHFGKKKISFHAGKPYGSRQDTGTAVRFRSLHFQGAAKSQMARYAAGQTYALYPLAKEHLKNTLKRLTARG